MMGRRLGPFLILRELGSGGMGTVHLAMEVRAAGAARTVAVKFVKAEIRSKVPVEHFFRERDILSGLQHPNIVRLLDSGATEDGQPYFAMEWINGVSLYHYSRNTAIDLGAKLGAFLRVCEAFGHCHARGIVHRDLKPSNVLVMPDGTPKLIDFGIARYMDASAEPDGGPLMFTPEYSSPEQIRGNPATARSDIYALGVILFEILAAERAPRQPLCRELEPVAAQAIREHAEERQATVDELALSVSQKLAGNVGRR